MAIPEVQAVREKVKPEADKIRAAIDTANSFVQKLSNEKLIELAEKFGDVGAVLTALVSALSVIDSAADALDGVIDAYASPAAAPAVPQAMVP